VFPLATRAKGAALATVAFSIAGGVINEIVPYLISAVTFWVFIIFRTDQLFHAGTDLSVLYWYVKTKLPFLTNTKIANVSSKNRDGESPP
jgi:hypothetical protein